MYVEPPPISVVMQDMTSVARPVLTMDHPLLLPACSDALRSWVVELVVPERHSINFLWSARCRPDQQSESAFSTSEQQSAQFANWAHFRLPFLR
jgi:hypothetical protein